MAEMECFTRTCGTWQEWPRRRHQRLLSARSTRGTWAARLNPPFGFGAYNYSGETFAAYQCNGYEGAWGKTGVDTAMAYIDQTKVFGDAYIQA